MSGKRQSVADVRVRHFESLQANPGSRSCFSLILGERLFKPRHHCSRGLIRIVAAKSAAGAWGW
jgi:hypothetical protein